MIKPEDIPKRAKLSILSALHNLPPDDVFERTAEQEIAAILNAAIETGVVSPPVWRLKRRNNGRIIGVVLSMEDAIRADAFMPTIEVEHWKGKTE